MRIVVGMLSALLLASVAFALARAEPVEEDQLNPEWGVVFPPAKAIALVHADSAKVVGAWDPSQVEVARMELALAEKLTIELAASQCPRRGACPHRRPITYRTDHPHRTRDYYRQYAAVYYKGRPTIFINGFHKSYVKEVTHPRHNGQTCELYCPECNPKPKSFPCDPLPDEAPDFWRTAPVVVFDGGNDFFWAAYDVDTGTVTTFYFNGVA